MRAFVLITVLSLGLHLALSAQQNSLPTEIIYKEIDTLQLKMEILYPPSLDTTQTYPSMVFFFGGGWRSGSINHFRSQAAYFAIRGMVCILVDYRVKNRHGTGIEECLMDAKSSIRYIREHADQLHVDPNRLVAAGGSAGGHLAASTAFIEGWNDPQDNLLISTIPNALVLFNPVIDLASEIPAVSKLVGEAREDISPLHQIKPGGPPTILFFGTEDKFVPVETARKYQTLMEIAGNRCDLFLYEGQKHGFFNSSSFQSSSDDNFFKKTVLETDIFLLSLGYLQNQPTIMETDR